MTYIINEQGVAGSWRPTKKHNPNVVTREELAALGFDPGTASCFNRCYDKSCGHDPAACWFINHGDPSTIKLGSSQGISGHTATERVVHELVVKLLEERLGNRDRKDSLFIIQ